MEVPKLKISGRSRIPGHALTDQSTLAKKLRQAHKPNIGTSTDHAPVPRARDCLNFFGQGSNT